MGQANYDLRVLTLKRWALPHTKALRDLPLATKRRFGDYISFQNYNFVDIDPVGSSSIPEAYKILLKKRVEYAAFAASEPRIDLNIQQSLVLLGRKTDFWQTEPDKVLSVSMIQLHASEELNPNELELALLAAFADSGGHVAVYFSLDYCDLVLFTRGIQLDLLHRNLWHLLYSSNPLAKDSTTILCFPYERFIRALRAPNDGMPIVDHPLSLIMDLNVHALDTPYQIETGLRNLGLESEPFQITGHYDMRILVREIPPKKFPALINLVDDHCRPSGQGGYINCEVVSICPLPERKDIASISPLPLKVTDDMRSSERLSELVLNIYRQYRAIEKNGIRKNSDFRRQTQSLSELYHSLMILHENRSSEEFVLSILPAMRELIPIFENYATAYETLSSIETVSEKTEQEKGKLFNMLYSLQDDVFRTVSMLVQCTMHSERKWIQAPTFNFTLFDIPPKLLAFYAAMACQITQSLNDEDRSFAFLISPDFQPDIYAQSLSQRVKMRGTQSCHRNKLLLVGLCEEDFYHPDIVLEALSHEASHYISGPSRRREERAKAIFDCVAMYLLGITLPFFLTDDFPSKQELSKLVNPLGMILLEDYLCHNEDSALLYFSSDLSAYFFEHSGIRPPFQDPSFKASLREKFTVALDTMSEGSLCKIAKTLDNVFHLAYFTPLLRDRKLRLAALDALAGQLVQTIDVRIYELQDSDKKEELENLTHFYMCLIQAFNESYADLRMIELIGIHDFSTYHRIANRYLKTSSGEKLQNYLRFNALLQSGICENHAKVCRLPLPMDDSLELAFTMRYVEQRLSMYLCNCHSTPVEAVLSQSYADISSPEIDVRVQAINSAIKWYKQFLIGEQASMVIESRTGY